MKLKITLESALTVTKYGLTPILCWPLPRGSSARVIFRHNFIWTIAVLQLILTILAACFTVYDNRHDFSHAVKVMTEIGALCSIVAKMVICKIEGPRIQALLAELEEFISQADQDEKDLLQRYVDNCLYPHLLIFGSAIFGPAAFIVGPSMTLEPLPSDTRYPFSIEVTWIRVCLYISQSICIIQVGCMVIVDILFAILLWYVSARFEMLSIEFEKANTVDELNRCAQKHQELIRIVSELKVITRIIAVEVSVIALYAVTTGGFVLMRHPSLYELSKYVLFEIGSAMELFVFAWPAGNLIDVSEKIGDAAFSCGWIEKSSSMHRNVLIVIQRSRDPMIISVNGVLPTLSLEFFGSTMAAAFSYLTSLRAIAGD